MLKADKRFTLKTPTGHKVVHKGDIFETESRHVLLGGYAHELTKQEKQSVLSEYVAEARELFGIEE